MLKKILTYSFFLVSFTGFSQNNNQCEQLLNEAEKIYFSNPDSSYQLSQAAEQLAIKNDDKQSIAKANSFLGKYLLLKSELEEASIKLNIALSRYKEIENYKGIAYVLKLKSILLKRIGNKDESLNILEESIQMSRKANDTNGLISSLLNISLAYSEEGEFKKAESALDEVEAINSFDKKNNYFLHQNKGNLFLDQNEPDKAIEEFFIAKKIAEENNMIDSYTTILKLLGKSYCEKNEFKESEAFFQQSKDVALKNNLENELIETYEELTILFVKENKFKEAFETLQLQNELKNKILNIEKINRISSLEKKLLISEKEKEIQQANAKTQLLQYVLITFAILFLLLFYMLYRTRILKNKISIQNLHLEEKNNIIEAKSKGLTDSIYYASRIQKSLLPTEKYIEKSIKRLKNESKNA